jgi:hypothetical protein
MEDRRILKKKPKKLPRNELIYYFSERKAKKKGPSVETD